MRRGLAPGAGNGTGRGGGPPVPGGCVITMDPGVGNIPGGDVLVSGRMIAAGPGLGHRPAGASDAVSSAGRASVW